MSWGGVKFSTPIHLLEAIYVIRKHNAIFLSNSLPFVLSRADANLSADYMDYQRDLCSGMFGLDCQIESSPLSNGLKLEYFRCCNLIITPNLEIKKENRCSGLEFKSFDDYLKKVRNILSLIKENAKDPGRIKPYGMLTTISRGYDAPATSALVKEIGCDRALTFNRPEHYAADSGADIAKILGYGTIMECDAFKYKEENNLDEAENMVTGDVGPDLLGCYRNEFADSLLFLGTRGDSLWERDHANVNDRQIFTAGNTLQQCCHSDSETCFEVNAVCVHLPMIGADRWSDLARISIGKDLKTYSTGNGYDRPIARKILEDKGVDGKMFGQKKNGMGISYHFDSFSRIKRKMSPAAAASLSEFKSRFKYNRSKMLVQRLKFYYAEMPAYLNYINAKLHIPVSFKKRERYYSSPHSTLLINWSINVIKKRYK